MSRTGTRERTEFPVAAHWRPAIDRDTDVLYRAIVAALRTSIRSGELRPGDRLPTHRSLARQLGVTVSTVSQAYAEANRLHLVSGQVGRGTFVLGEAVDAALFESTFVDRNGDNAETIRAHIDLSSNVPAKRPDDLDLARTLTDVVETAQCDTGYLCPRGIERGRAVMNDLLLARGYAARRNEIVLTAGAQQGLLAALITVVGAGGRVLVEELSFPGMKSAVRHLNLQAHGVRMDEYGALPRELERLAKRTGAKTFICVPSLHNPTGATMNDERRADIAGVARRLQLTLIEDDVYGLLQDEPSLVSVAPEHTIMVTSLSKTVAPALRLGALAGRHPALAQVARETSLTSWVLSPTMVEVAMRWHGTGTMASRIAWQRYEIAARSAIVDAELGRNGIVSPHRWLATQTPPDRAAELAALAGVEVVPGSALAFGTTATKGIRLSLTAARSRSELHEAITRLRSTSIRWA